MNPTDLLTARRHIDRVMNEARPEAPQQPLPVHPVRDLLARAAASAGVTLLALSQRLNPARQLPRPGLELTPVTGQPR